MSGQLVDRIYTVASSIQFVHICVQNTANIWALKLQNRQPLKVPCGPCSRRTKQPLKEAHPNFQTKLKHNILYHVTTHYNTSQHVTTCYNTSQHPTTCCKMSQHVATCYNPLQHITTHCNTSQHPATRRKMLQHVTTRHNMSQHVTTRHNMSQYVTSRYSTLHPGQCPYKECHVTIFIWVIPGDALTRSVT